MRKLDAKLKVKLMSSANLNAKLKVKLNTKVKTESKLMSNANKNKHLSATLPGSGARKVLDGLQVHRFVVAQFE